MEEKIKQVDVFEKVKSGTKEIKIFVALDGKEFDNDMDCFKYENNISYSKHFLEIEHKSFLSDVINIPSEWYFIKNKFDMKSFLWYSGFYNLHDYDIITLNENNFKEDDFQFNEWYSYEHWEDDYRHNEVLHIYSLDGIRNDVNNFINSLES